MDWLDPILRPIMWVVAWIMYGAHWAGDLAGLPQGLAWILSIIVLVVIMRILMIPLFVKQIRSSRGMQLLQPELQKIQKRYKGKTDPVSRRRMQEETMALYRKNGSNPMSGCWPVLLQSPLFFALFRVLYSLGKLADGQYKSGGEIRASIGPITKEVALQIEGTRLFGAPLSATFLDDKTWAGASPVAVRVVTVVLIILMSATTFTTQRQLTMKNMPETAKDNPMFRTQKMMMYAMPLIFMVSGVNFPIGVLIYWLTTNLWTMGQQFIVIRNMPAPGSEAEERLKERRARKRLKKGLPAEEEAKGGGAAVPAPTDQPKRVQPKRTTRSQRRSGPLRADNPSPRADGPRRELEPADAEPDQGEAAADEEGAGDRSPRPDGQGHAEGRPGGASKKGKGTAGKTTGSAARGPGGAVSGSKARPGGEPGGQAASGQRQQPKKQSRKKRK
jgi:YidC/Oxa1 family membrane protein insertase